VARTTVIRGAAAAVLVAGAVLGIAGCSNAEKPASPSDEPTVSYGNPPVTTPSVPPSTLPSGSGKPSTGSSGSANPTSGSSPTTG
jgi:hypothetical protein